MAIQWISNAVIGEAVKRSKELISNIEISNSKEQYYDDQYSFGGKNSPCDSRSWVDGNGVCGACQSLVSFGTDSSCNRNYWLVPALRHAWN